MSSNNRVYFLLLIIFFIAFFLRFIWLDKIHCLNWDEASFAYNSYSILKTGQDEYGANLPLQFKSVSDYKAPMYIYLMVPVIKLLGLNEFSVRLIPSLLGSVSVLFFYAIVSSLFKRKDVALISAFFLAISPWHIQFTRAGADVSVSSFFVLMGILGFIKGVKGFKYGFLLSFLAFVASAYSYFGERLFVPILFIFITYLFKDKIIKHRLNFIISGLLGFILLIPLLPSLVSGGHREKIFKTSIFGYERPKEYIDLLKLEDSESEYYLFHSELYENLLGAGNRYLNHFSPSFLFLKGPVDDPRQYIYRMGMLYLFELPLLVLGLRKIFLEKKEGKFLVMGWLLIAPIPAAITKDVVHARRAFNMVYPLTILSAFGAVYLIKDLRSLVSAKILTVTKLIIGALFIYSVAYYLVSYFIFSPRRSYKGPSGWQCGYRELVEYISPIKDNYKEVIVDTTYQGPYIFFLFYEQYPPKLYQPQAKLIQESKNSLGEGYGYDRYRFRPIYWPKDRCLKDHLFAGPPERLPEKDIKEGESRIINEIKFKNGKTAFLIVESLGIDKDYCAGVIPSD